MAISFGELLALARDLILSIHMQQVSRSILVAGAQAEELYTRVSQQHSEIAEAGLAMESDSQAILSECRMIKTQLDRLAMQMQAMKGDQQRIVRRIQGIPPTETTDWFNKP